MDNRHILGIVILALLIWWLYSSSKSVEGIGFPMGAYPYNWKHGYQFQSPFYGFDSNDPAYYQRQYIWY